MQIIIPMSGMGQRFVNAGYKDPKPLIEINGKPIIEHVVDMFPNEENFIFICNSKHLKETNMRDVLKRIAPKCKIYEIPPHKLGPVYAVHQIADMISDEDEVIVNYCDFGCYWDYADFLKHTRERNADGAVPAYKGFHPHMLGTTNYAFMRDSEQWMLEIKEKEPFTDNRMEEYASSGTYYFKTGKIVKRYFKELMDKDVNLNGEFYVSLIYNLLVQDKLSVSIYDIQHMLQWGTPQDVEEYNVWSEYFKNVVNEKRKIELEKGSINLIPLAGAGSRFVKAGYDDPKPLISVSGKPMIIQAASYLPEAEKNVFVCRSEHLNSFPLNEALVNVYPDARIVEVEKLTEGQACTCELGLTEEDMESPLLIAACDNGMLWNAEKYKALIDDLDVDAIVWSFKDNPSSERNPQMYGWIKIDDQDNVTGVSVKKAISDNPRKDHAIVGTFYFRKAQYFQEALNHMYEQDIRVNGEFYADSCIDVLAKKGYKVKVFEVDHYICWGTPEDYNTFEYWQSFFHKVDWHPYKLELDTTMNNEAIDTLDSRYSSFEQEWR